MMISSRVLGVVAGTAILAASAACGSNGDGSGSGTGLTAALGSVATTGPVTPDVSYGDLARLLDADQLPGFALIGYQTGGAHSWDGS